MGLMWDVKFLACQLVGVVIPSTRFRRLPQQFRFLAIGGVNTVFGYLVFGLLAMTARSDSAVVLMAYLAHVLVSPLAFFLYRSLVFPSTRRFTSAFIRFQAGYALPLALNGPLLYFGITVLDGDPLVVQALLTIMLAIMTFVANRYFVFSSPRGLKSEIEKA